MSMALDYIIVLDSNFQFLRKRGYTHNFIFIIITSYVTKKIEFNTYINAMALRWITLAVRMHYKYALLDCTPFKEIKVCH